VAARESGATASFVEVGHGDARLAVEISGRGPAFVWGHPLMGSMRAEERAGVFDWSATGARLIRYDARSHGRSSVDPRAEHHRWEVLADDMLEVATAADAPSAIFGGGSMGAATAVWAALLAPKRVRGLVLAIPPTAWGARERQRRVYRVLGAAAATRLLLPLMLGLRLPRPRPERGTRAALADAVAHDVSHRSPPHLAPPLRGAAMSDLPSVEDIARIEVPTLVLAWRGDRSHPLSVAHTLESAMPRADLVIAEGGDLSTWPTRVADFAAHVAATND
jgi:pimeloyl-ACP methyl ester carboxylesterase